DSLVSREVIEVGPNGEKVDLMTFRGSFEREVKEFVDADAEMKSAVSEEDDDAVRRSCTSGFTIGRKCSIRRTNSSVPMACRHRRRLSSTTRSARNRCRPRR